MAIHSSKLGIYIDKDKNFCITDKPTEDMEEVSGVYRFTVHASVDSVVTTEIHAYPTDINLTTLPEHTKIYFDGKRVSKETMADIKDAIEQEKQGHRDTCDLFKL